jgi:hypothetical protein
MFLDKNRRDIGESQSELPTQMKGERHTHRPNRHLLRPDGVTDVPMHVAIISYGDATSRHAIITALRNKPEHFGTPNDRALTRLGKAGPLQLHSGDPRGTVPSARHRHKRVSNRVGQGSKPYPAPPHRTRK